MAERTRRQEAARYFDLPVAAAEQFFKGEMACLDTATGLVVRGQASTTLVPVGYFQTNGTGDGTTLHPINLFDEVWFHWWDNDGINPVAGTDLQKDCYIVDEKTVSIDDAAGTRSVAGKVWGVSTRYGVLVRMVRV